jgi:hypothetical protein
MIKQGSNEPIVITFDVQPADISVTLHNEIATLKHWNKDDLTPNEDGLSYSAPYTQEESLEWEEGPCEIQVRWVDSAGDYKGKVQSITLREIIEHSGDTTILDTGD